MSNTEADSENQVTSSTGNAEEMPESAKNDQKNVVITDKTDKEKAVDIAAEPSEITTNEVSFETVNISSETSADAVDESKIEPVSSNDDKGKAPDAVESTEINSLESSANPEDVQDQLQKILGDASVESTPKSGADGPSEKSPNVTTENLLSVLEDDVVSTPKKPTEPLTPSPSQSATKSKPGPASTKLTPPTSLSKLAHAAETSKSSKRYIYKLKSKSGKVLRYTSCTPIILKKPVIKLTKMAEEDMKAECSPRNSVEPEEVDSDNSTKENMKGNDASGDAASTATAAAAATPIKTPRRGRPPLSQKKLSTPAPAGGAEDRNSSDTSDNNKTTPAFSMQTRKRQIKFLPDGRVMSTGKKRRLEEGAAEESSVTENEADYDTDDNTQSNKSGVKKHSPLERLAGEKKGKFKKVFDFESYFREKTGLAPTPAARNQVETASPASSVGKALETPKSRVVPSSTTSKKVTSVDPAQLLSSLIGVPIAASQLNIVKFKPKVIQERTNAAAAAASASTPKKVHFEDTTKKPASSSAELLKNTPFKVVSKPTFQKILPKPTVGTSSFLERSSARKALGVLSGASPTTSFSPIAPKGMTMKTTPVTADSPKFESYTDTKVVKTKGGPKKAKKRKSTDGGGDDTPKTVYDLVNDVFDQMPSWNLHVIPDTKSFCIAQVARGRMGIPILKKSIELNSEFFAKVYVHQLHCKRYDGVYDTESKIVTLIREIDALAA